MNKKTQEKSLGIFRIVYCLSFFYFAIPNLASLSSTPSEFFHPRLGIQLLFSSYYSPEFAITLHIIAHVAAGLLLFGIYPKTSSIILGISTMFIFSNWYSTGKIAHNFMIWLTPLLFSFSNWAKHYSIQKSKEKPKHISNYIQLSSVLIVGLAFMESALVKMSGGWLHPDKYATLYHLFSNNLVMGKENILTPFFLDINNLFIWKLIDYGVILFEFAIIFLLVPKKFRFIGLAFTYGFHTLTILIFNISFITNIFTLSFILCWEKIIRARMFYVTWFILIGITLLFIENRIFDVLFHMPFIAALITEAKLRITQDL